MFKLITDIIHPDYVTNILEWEKWRLTYEGGANFIDSYLRRLSKRETSEDFADRKALTYCPAFAKEAVNEVKDSIYQRMGDISRIGGSLSYQSAITGLSGGVDLEGSSMNFFMGCKILQELLTMQKVGIFVDMPPILGPSLADNAELRPYIYMYEAENLRCWVDDSNNPNEFLSVLLREYTYEYDDETGFPCGTVCRYRSRCKI